MKKFIVLACLIIFGSCIAEDKRFAIIVCSYNNADWYTKNLDAIFAQNYDNWYMIYTDDLSPDGTAELVEAYVKARGMQDKVIIVKNTERKRALANLYNAIHMCDPQDVVVINDGDDWLAYDGVLTFLNDVYQNPDVWLTYGQYQEWPSGTMGFCVPMPDYVVKSNTFRYFPNGPSHLRTFYAGLFHKIDKKDLMRNGEFFPMTYDLAIMYPMMEMANWRFKFIPEVLLTYNAANSLNDHKVNKQLQRELDMYIRRLPMYEPLDALFQN